LARKYKDNNKYIVIGLDSVLGESDPETRNQHALDIKKILLEKYGDKSELSSKYITKYYEDIIKYIKDNNKIGVIEGGSVGNIDLIGKLKGRVIVRRTAKIKCYIRAVIRDCKNPDWLAGLSFAGKLKRYIHVAIKRTEIFRNDEIDKFMTALDKK